MYQSVDAFVFEFVSAAGAAEDGVGWKVVVEDFFCDFSEYFFSVCSFFVEGVVVLWYELVFESVRCDDIDRFVEQLLTFFGCDLADGSEAVGGVCGLFFGRVFADHIEFLCHLVAVVLVEIVV